MNLELEQKDEATTRAKPLTLWLVDDNAAYREALAELFRQVEAAQGLYCARQFDSAEALLEVLAKESAPDVILSDVQMGGMSGVEAVALIKQIAPQTRVILLTTFYNSSAALQAHRNGAEAFLLKRYAFEQIAAAVRASRTARKPPGSEPAADMVLSPEAASHTFLRRSPLRWWQWWETGRTLLRIFLRSRTPTSAWPKS